MEKNMIKKIIAREWLILIGSLLLGIICFPINCWIIGLIINPDDGFSIPDNYIILFLIPYFLIQFVRSVIWAIKVLKKSKSE